MTRSPDDTPTGFAEVGEEEARTQPYRCICVVADGSARELHADQRNYRETRFQSFEIFLRRKGKS